MRHAILIMAHHNFDQLDRLCRLFLDDRFHVYLHVDARVGMPDDAVRRIFSRHNVTTVESREVCWGGYSQVDCEMRLITAAVKDGGYDRLHLLSGDDLPIKSLDEIDSFFEGLPPFEYLAIKESGTASEVTREVRERIDLFWPRQEVDGRSQSIRTRMGTALQRLVPPHRIASRGIRVIGKGANWFSITGGFAEFVVANGKWVEDAMRQTRCADEVFLQTLALNSSFAGRIAPFNSDDNLMALRLIDWKRGGPYTWRLPDLGEILSSGALFARKFDMAADPELFDAICRRVRA